MNIIREIEQIKFLLNQSTSQYKLGLLTNTEYDASLKQLEARLRKLEDIIFMEDSSDENIEKLP